jgi:hypothetical protein
LPLPAVGFQPAAVAAANWRKRPTVTSYLSSRKSAICALNCGSLQFAFAQVVPDTPS